MLFDDDGRVYIVHGNTTIRITELNDDLSAPRKNGLCRVLVKEKDNGFLSYEGSHIQKINGTYYLFLIHSLSHEWKRAQACYRSDSLRSRFVGGDVLCDDMGFFGQGVAQGGIVDTPSGEWFAILFQDRGAVGRLPVLVPVRWESGRPIFGEDGKVPTHVTTHTTRADHPYSPLWISDDFMLPVDENGHGALKPVWEWNHQPDPRYWRILPEIGALQIETGKVGADVTEAANMLTQRMRNPSCAAEITIDASNMRDGDCAGLCALQGNYGYIGICREGRQWRLVVRARTDGQVQETDFTVCADPVVTLRLEASFERLQDEASFFYQKDAAWHRLGRPHPLRFQLDHFTGCRFGLFLFSARQAGGSALFRQFRYLPTSGAGR